MRRIAPSTFVLSFGILSYGCSGGESPSALTPVSALDGATDAFNVVEAGDAFSLDSYAVDSGQDTAPEAPGSKPVIVVPGKVTIDEDVTEEIKVDVQGATRVWLTGLPPGARWDEPKRTIVFTPDFIQGGGAWTVTVTARNSVGEATATFSIEVNNTIAPPLPTVDKDDDASGYRSVWLRQQTDSYLDAKGYAGRTLQARVIVPDGATAQKRMPVRIYLHGFGGGVYDGAGSGGQFRIYPHDPMNTYWWGYGEHLPGAEPTSGVVPNYTQRRVLHLLEWVLRTYPGADPERVYVTGGSMGGAGALELGAVYGRHFAFVDASVGQAIPRNHRPSRIKQLRTLWGAPDAQLLDGTALEDGTPRSVWDRQDLTRLLLEHTEARQQFYFTKHGKDDPTIHFGAVVLPSPLTSSSTYAALQSHRIGHYAVWDEGGHGTADPVMGGNWWDASFSLVFDDKSYLRRDLPFPAFSAASHDWDPGDGSGNGKQTWSAEAGYAGKEDVAGDTGWTGDIAGALNRFLRWDSNVVVDELDRLEMSLFVQDGTGSGPPKAGYPSKDDLFDRTLPVVVKVTPRRVRAFICAPGEILTWQFGSVQGTTKANDDGSVTVDGIALTTTPQKLVITR